MGAESAAIQVLRGLVDAGHDMAAVLPEHGDASGSGLRATATALDLPVLDAGLVTDPGFADWIASHEIDLLLNVHSLSIVRGEVAAAPRIGSFNLHPGPLPAYAGLNVVSWAIFRGETSHAVTLHWMDAGIDTGGIAYEARFPIGEEDTGLSVFTQCVRRGVPLVFELLEQAERDPAAIPARRHSGERTVYRRRDVPQEGRIAWDRPAARVHDLLRACDFGPFPSPCGHPATSLRGRTIRVVGATRTHRAATEPAGTVAMGSGGVPAVACADEWLEVRRLVVDGRRTGAAEVLQDGDVLGPPPPVD